MVSFPSERLTDYHFMDTENEQDVVVESQEDTTQEVETEEIDLDLDTEEVEDTTVSIDKTELNRLRRKAIAYDSSKGQPKTAQPKSEANSDERFERLELRTDGYTNEEIDEIMALGGTKVLGSKIVQAAIKTMRQEKKSKDASTDVSSKSPVYKKFTQEDLSKMSAKDMEKILAE